MDKENKQPVVFNLHLIVDQHTDLLKRILDERSNVYLLVSGDDYETRDRNRLLIKENSMIQNNYRSNFTLTKRETEIIDYLAKGFLDKEIADSLGLSLHTVKNHLKNIYLKMKVNNRLEAIIEYLNLFEKSINIIS